ncbi:cation:proton antiporter [Calycomorphotria hydatis]|uniref:K(+)/H(+) antiporter NhaP n=1 Tax=Calycomorphotria hydatis TaxID=2528027 RepID=A0A517T426_9PLAN|nr:sodium:proton antiporter [Calycomorphotria hydatis]QDT63127.1 K(+)/H(+) antiporter NhaP [Calycomorphotria hydatis]
MTPTHLTYLAGVIVIGIAAQWIAWRIRVPAILLLLAAGFGFGQAFPPDDYLDTALLFPATSLAVAVILFEGGLTLRFRELKSSGSMILRLVTLGCLATGILGAIAARMLVFESWSLSILAGAIFTVTGPTVVIPLLRFIRPSGRVASIAKWEGIVIDPIGAVLAVLVFEALIAAGPGEAFATVMLSLMKTLVVGIVVGGGIAILLILILERHWVPDYLDAPVLLATVVGSFAASNVIQSESGLLTVTLMGILLANQKRVEIDHLIEFKEHLGVLLISVLFVVLSGRVEFKDLTDLGWQSLLFIGVLILIVRPAAVMTALVGSSLNWRERLFLSWLAPRGIVAAAVASIFALELEHHPEIDPFLVEDAEKLVPLTFLVIIGTVAVYGLTAGILARRLKLADQSPQGLFFAGACPIVRAIAKAVQNEDISVLLVDSNRDNVRQARMDGIRTRHGNILSETLQEDLDLFGIGRFLAMTPNDEVNSLAAIAMRNLFGRSNVYQLPPRADRSATSRTSSNPSAGRRLFGQNITYDELERRVELGEAVVKKTLLTSEFDFKAFKELYGDDGIVLFVIPKAGTINVRHAGDTSTPHTGHKLISLVIPREDSPDFNPASHADESH